MTIPVYYHPKQNCTAAVGYSPSAGKPALVMQDWLKHGLITESDVHSFEPLNREDIVLAHSRRYVDDVLDCVMENGFGNVDPDVAASLPYTTGSFAAAAEHAVTHGGIAFSLTSGFHHARWDQGGGFCTFNGLMIAAHLLRAQGLAKRILIIDGDAHHGDGTEDIINRTKASSWIKHITARKSYCSVNDFMFETGVKKLASDFEQMWDGAPPDLVMYQAGADAWKNDPLGAGMFTLPQLEKRDASIFRAAKKYGVPIVVNLAGGYSKDKRGSIEPVLKIHRQTMEVCLKEYT